MTPTQLIESYLRGRAYATYRSELVNDKVGKITHRIDLAYGHVHRSIYIGEIGIAIAALPLSLYQYAAIIVVPYADPDLKIKLHQAIDEEFSIK